MLVLVMTKQRNGCGRHTGLGDYKGPLDAKMVRRHRLPPHHGKLHRIR
jgi:hypothetical protein